MKNSKDGLGSRRRVSAALAAGRQERNTKRRGELAELAFAHKASAMGFKVSKPYGDSERYDFVVDSGARLWRVQVKCTTSRLCGMYRINSHRRTAEGVVPYDPRDVDFLVCYVLPEDVWFVIPIEVACRSTSVLLCPKKWGKDNGKFERYREAWGLMRGESQSG
jgi:hypothetical protein